MKKRAVILSLFLVLLSALVSAQEDCLYYFYGEGCPHCGATNIFLDKLQVKYPGLQITKFEVYYERDNLKLLQEHFDAYEVPLEKQGVPIVFLSDSYFVGDKPIIDYLENALLSREGKGCPSLEEDGAVGVIGQKSPKHLIETLTFGVVTGGAIIDSINPCAIAVLLILLGALLVVKDRRRLVKTGLAFIAAVYLAYFLFGVGILAALRFTGASYYFYKAIGVLAILIGLLNIKDYFWHGKVILMEIPLKWRPGLKKLLQRAVSPAGAFIAGFVVCLFELPCTGGPYLIILGLLAEKVTRWAAMPLLVYYNLVFVLPLVVILLAVYFSMKKIEEHGKQVKVDICGEIEKWRQRNIKLLHLVGGLVMVGLGAVILVFL